MKLSNLEDEKSGSSSPLTREGFIHSIQRKPRFLGFHEPYLRMLDGNYLAAFFLDELVYWHLPPAEKNKDSRLGFYRDGFYWLVKNREYWCNKYCTNDRQYNRTMNILLERDLISTRMTRRKGKTVPMIRLNWSSFLKQYEETMEGQNFLPEKSPNQPKIEEGQIDSPKATCRTECPAKDIIEGQNVLSLYSILLEKILLDNTHSFESSQSVLNRYKIQSIGDKIARVLLSICSDPKPVLVLNDYDELWSEFDKWKTCLFPRYYTTNENVNGFLSAFSHRPTENSATRAYLIWSTLSCDELFVNGRPILMLLLFLLGQTKEKWIPPGFCDDDYDIILMALYVYYKVHENDFDWPNEESKESKPA